MQSGARWAPHVSSIASKPQHHRCIKWCIRALFDAIPIGSNMFIWHRWAFWSQTCRTFTVFRQFSNYNESIIIWLTSNTSPNYFSSKEAHFLWGKMYGWGTHCGGGWKSKEITKNRNPFDSLRNRVGLSYMCYVGLRQAKANIPHVTFCVLCIAL